MSDPYWNLKPIAFLPPDRQLRLYLRIARIAREDGPRARGLRHAAIKNAWRARNEMRAKEKENDTEVEQR